MQVFIVGSPLDTAMALDRRRLNKQIIECRQILAAIEGTSTAWANHPCTLQYKNHVNWLRTYMWCLEEYVSESPELLMLLNYDKYCENCKPDFHTQEYLDQMKRRLYTKNNVYYTQWSSLGESQENWYFVDGEWRRYINGKRIK